MSENENVKTVRVCYLGLWANEKGKRFHKWAEIPDDVDLSDKSAVLVENNVGGYTKSLGPGRPGVVWSVQMETQPDGSEAVLGSNRKYLQMWPNSEQVMKWQLASAALSSKLTAQRKARKSQNTDFIADTLAPIRSLYRKSSPSIRRQILAIVLEAITHD